MKKKFIEPEMKRIELKLNENIASSDGVQQTVLGAFIVSHGQSGCLESVQGTDYGYPEFVLSEEGWTMCRRCALVSQEEAARRMGVSIPKQ